MMLGCVKVGGGRGGGRRRGGGRGRISRFVPFSWDFRTRGKDSVNTCPSSPFIDSFI